MSIRLTDRAAVHIRRFLDKQGRPGAAVRLGVKPTGCSGYAYTVAPVEDEREGDQVFESQGIRVVVDATSLGYLDGMEVDYAREGLNEGLKFNNPNVKATCGCGESFSV